MCSDCALLQTPDQHGTNRGTEREDNFLPEIRVMLNQLTFCVHLAVFVKRAY